MNKYTKKNVYSDSYVCAIPKHFCNVGQMQPARWLFRWFDALEPRQLKSRTSEVPTEGGPSWIWCLAVSTSCFQCSHFQLHKNYETDSKSVFLSVLRFYIRGFIFQCLLAMLSTTLLFQL